MHWGKQKLKVLYAREYGEEIFAWKIERVIRKHGLFPRPDDVRKLQVKKRKAAECRRVHTLEVNPAPWWLVHLDTIVIYWGSEKRHVLRRRITLRELPTPACTRRRAAAPRPAS